MDCYKDKNGRKEKWTKKKKNNVNSSFQQISDENRLSNYIG